jgi:hypothetical protein
MYFFQERLVEYAIAYFNAKDFVRPSEGDEFWGLFAPGNTVPFSDRPFERFSDYEELLRRLMDADTAKYQRMHKGTPFYYMAWLAFDLRNYEKALFFLDASISEDVRKDPVGWRQNPGARSLLLDPEGQAALRTVDAVQRVLQAELTRFNAISNLAPMDIHASWGAFVRQMLADQSQRTLISAMYVFLLESRDRWQELSLRQGSTGGSNQPFTIHLFTGGLLFESLLKYCYPVNDQGQPNKTLGGILQYTAGFKTDFAVPGGIAGSAGSLAEIHTAIQGSSSVETAFATAAKLRNTTGHNLVWDDIFATPSQYTDLFRQLVNALLFVVAKKFVRPATP